MNAKICRCGHARELHHRMGCSFRKRSIVQVPIKWIECECKKFDDQSEEFWDWR